MPSMELPLFPLRAVMFPYGRMPLQVFEPRYVQLIKTCIRDQSLFGIVCIEQGNEVGQPANMTIPDVAMIGTRVRVADWFSMEHGLLGIVAEGQDRFSVNKTWQAANQLLMAEVTLVPEPLVELAVHEHSLLSSLWDDLRRHPQLQELGYPLMPATDAALLGSLLQVLPIDDVLRYRLLEVLGDDGVPELKRWLHEHGVV